MRFQPLDIDGSFLVIPECLNDNRGFFARSYCEREFEEHGLSTRWLQSSISYNHLAGTLRGLHYQVSPNEENKLVRCTQGAVYDVILDLRKNSPTYLNWCAIELNASNHHQVYIPRGVAHGFYTLLDATELSYQMDTMYAPECARGVRWDDPAFSISWPGPVRVISERDSSCDFYCPEKEIPAPA